MECLEVPAAGDQLIRQIVQQLGMAWPHAHAAEIIRSRDDAAPEMELPKAIGNHARGERIVRLYNPIREIFARSLRLELRRAVRQQHAERSHPDAPALVLI